MCIEVFIVYINWRVNSCNNNVDGSDKKIDGTSAFFGLNLSVMHLCIPGPFGVSMCVKCISQEEYNIKKGFVPLSIYVCLWTER